MWYAEIKYGTGVVPRVEDRKWGHMKVIVVDVQKGITDTRLYNYEGFLVRVKRLLTAARQSNVEVIYVKHDDGPGSGFSVGDEDFEIADALAPMEGEKVFVKEYNSCFSNKKFEAYLEECEENTLIVVGLQSDFCINATIQSAFDREYRIIVPKGCNTTFDNDYMDGATTYRFYNEYVWPDRFAQCISVEDTIHLMLGQRRLAI